MGVKDFESMFDTIDISRKGTITVEELRQFCELLYFAPVCIQHVEGAVKQVCENPAVVRRREFLDVLTDVERRRAVDEQAFWDFQALDYTGQNRITLQNALLLFKEFHGDAFSLATWRRFLSSRENSDSDVCFDEIRFWLCSPPVGSACHENEFTQEEQRVIDKKTENGMNEFNNLKQALGEDAAAERNDHVEHQTAHARRKLNKWNKQGLEAMLFDDGLDVDDTEVKDKPKSQVTLADLNELLDVKYEKLKQKLMMEMARLASTVDDEIPEVYEQIKLRLKQLVTHGQDAQDVDDIPSATMQMLASLTGLMGELRLQDREHRRQIEEMKNRLKDKGKSIREIGLAVQERYEQIISGNSSCAGLLQQLHRRHQQERETLLTTLKIDTNQPLGKALIIEYVRIMRQVAIIDEESKFIPMATAVGLAERAVDQKPERADWDRSRSERLAQLRLEDHVGKQLEQTAHDQPNVEALEKSELVDLQVTVAMEMTQKHFYEREMLIHILLGKDARDSIDKACKLKPDERKVLLKSLQSQHKNWKLNPQADPAIYKSILLQALGLKWEERKAELESGGVVKLSQEELREILFADLQQKQGGDFEGVLQELQNMTTRQLVIAVGRQCEARIAEHFDNIASVLLGTIEISEEDEEYIKALEHKYDILRKRIFLMALKDKLDWKNLSKEEKQSALRDIMKQEKKLRSEGKLQEMGDLLGLKARANTLPALRSLIGEDKAEYSRRKMAGKHEEIPVDETEVVNILADLVPRQDREQEFLLSWLHSPEGKGLIMRMKRMRIVEIKVEGCRLEMEDEFEIATLSTGLMERVKDTLTSRHESDNERQSELARRRVRQRRLRLQQNEEYRQDPTIAKDNVPHAGDITGLQVVYLHEMLKRHCDERETLLNHLQDESLEDVVEAAATMDDSERQRRLAELQAKRQNLNLTMPDDKEEHVSILEECAAIRAVSVREGLASIGQNVTMETVAVVILAELQEEQDREVALTLQNIENMNEEDIRTSLSRELNNRRLGNTWNVISVLTRYQGEATDDLLLKALETKYTLLRQKLLVDCLRIRMGTDQWEALSQNDKQQKVLILDNQAVEQIQIGKIMPSLLGEGFHLQETVTQMMGLCQHVFRNKVKGQQVIGNHSNLSMSEDTGAVSKKRAGPENPLKSLIARLEEERHALTRQLRGQAEDHFSEQKRLIQLTRYHREIALANQDESFATLATMVALCERQQEEIKFRLEHDVERYGKVAAKWIQDIERGRQHTLETEAPQSHSVVELLDHMMLLLEKKHIKERELFCRLLSSTDKMTQQKTEAASTSRQDRHRKMAELYETRQKSVKERGMENMEVLTEGTILKKEDRRSDLFGLEEGDDALLRQSLMASLLEYQNSEAERLICYLAGKTEESIQLEEKKILQDTKSNMADNIACIVLSLDPKDSSNTDDIIEALEGKYDALRDKLLAEALMKELGESEWNRLSEKERQRRILQLKLKERQLRKSGKIDEANALLAELLKDQEHLRQLMGDTEQEQRKRLQERLRKRKERLAQGMTVAEVDALERKEMAEEEMEDKYKERNIMEDLQNRFEQEKDEILRQLQAAGDQHERERERQALLARLHRDQRLAEKEGNFDAAALILGLAQQIEQDLRRQQDEQRKHQERLAFERLEAARKRGHKVKVTGEDAVPVNVEDPLSLQDAISKNLDHQHELERQMFIQLLQESLASPSRRAAEKMSDIERDDCMFEINERYKHWSNSEDHDLKEQIDLLRDAIGVMLEILRAQSALEGRDMKEDDLQVTLLADLQEKQLQESQNLLSGLSNKDLKDLQHLHKLLSAKKDTGCYDNIATVLLGDRLKKEGEDSLEETTEEAEVIRALQEKYDAMKDKLMMEALMKELGEQEWDRLNETQRQKKLIELKLKERKLRREGKLGEIALLIGSHLENEKLLDELMVENARQQRERHDRRLARRRQLVAERQAQGLDTDEDTINDIMEQEEEEEKKTRRRNILDDLQKNFDEEKRHLLLMLSNQKSKVDQERMRQIELAKLKRDELRLKRGDKLNDVIMIIQNLKESDKKREQVITAERDRQRALAKERLEERKRRKGQKTQKDTLMGESLDEAEDRTVQEALLITLETRHEDEMDIMLALLDTARGDKSLANVPEADVKLELAKLEQEHQKWRKHSAQQLAELDERNMTAQQSEQHMADVASNKSDQLKILSDATGHRLEVERRLLQGSQTDLDPSALEQEVEVTIVTDLQEKQTAENRAVQKLLEDQDDAVLQEVKHSLHILSREGWYDNLAHTIFNLTHPDSSLEEEDGLEEKFEEKLAELEKEMEAETENAIKSAKALGEDVDVDAIRRQIMEEYEKMKKKMLSEKESQKGTMRRKLEARRLIKEQRDWEGYAARTLLRQAKENARTIEGNVATEKGRQSNALQQKLAERREARREARSVRDAMARDSALDTHDNKRNAPSSRGSNETPLPTFSLRREKTVVDVEVTDEQKQALLSQVVQQQRNLQNKITEQQRRQEEMLRRRLDSKKGRQTEEAAELISLGERQKTTLEKSQQDEKARQLQVIQDRVRSQREKREPSPGPNKIKQHNQ
ncbi:uncharacterized protein LOC127856876 isoform X2 [Dreissena polymorpha]|uniref:uncharacterized protein LOC127856876 isoform X2 n=1 Tax=Dreissena polymorpha TaxID=45954 RepID=UPI0022644F10|nr:uncharacterized protein LOC127856876 isoform X2 [Dreissena polymorpha]